MVGKEKDRVQTIENQIEELSARLPAMALDSPVEYRRTLARLEELRTERERLARANDEKSRRERTRAEARAAKERAASLRRAKSVRHEVETSTMAIDKALANLETAMKRHGAKTDEFIALLRELGVDSPSMRLSRQRRYMLRWALAHFAPTFHDAAEMHHVRADRRRPMSVSMASHLPVLPRE